MERVKKHLKAIIVAIILLISTILGATVLPPILNPDIEPAEATATIRPEGDGTYHQLFPQLATNWQYVDDTGEGDGDGTYLDTSTSDENYYKDLYETENFTLPEAHTIDNVTVYTRVRSESASFKSTWYIMIKTHDTEYQYYKGQPDTTYTLYSHVFSTNPNTTSAWTEAEVKALEIGERGKSKWDKLGTGLYYKGRCTQTYAVVHYSPPPSGPNYNNVGKSSNDTGEQQCTFYANWTATSGSPSYYIFSSTNSGPWVNTSAISFSGGTWSNHTIVLNETGGCTIQWQFFANQTGNSIWNATGIQSFWCWKRLPNVLERYLGDSSGGGIWSGSIFYNGSDGGTAAIYTAYSNSSFAQWHHQIAAFNLNTEVWTDSYDLGLGGSNTHWNPSVSILPNGSLIVFSGYMSNMKYRVGKNNCTTESNLTKIVSEWNPEQNSGAKLDYPMPLRWNDRLIVLGRTGPGDTTGGGNWTMRVWNATAGAFDPQVVLIDFGVNIATYAYAHKHGNDVLLGFTNRTTSPHDIFMIWSSDKGATWKFVNGTSVTLPLNVTNGLAGAKIATSAASTSSGAPFIDENNHPCILGFVNTQSQGEYNNQPKLAQYNSTLGSNGIWTYQNITYANGTSICGVGVMLFLDPYYNRPSGWFSPESNGNRIIKIVRECNETFKFRVVYTDETYDNMVVQQAHYISNVVDCPEAYEFLSREMVEDALSHLTVEPEQGATDEVTLYAVKLNASMTTKIAAGQVFFNTTGVMLQVTCALYNTTFHLICEGSDAGHQGLTGLRWSAASSFDLNLSSVVLGQEYWLAFEISLSSQNPYYFYRENDTEYYHEFFNYSVPYYGYYPSVLNVEDIEYSNRTVTCKAYPSFLVMRGVGRKFPSKLSVGWNDIQAWNTDVDHTLAEVNASLNLEEINWTVIMIDYQNGTVWEFIWDQPSGEYYGWPDKTVYSTSDIIAVYCLESGEWNHVYA